MWLGQFDRFLVRIKLLILTLMVPLALVAMPPLAGAQPAGPLGDQHSAVAAQYGQGGTKPGTGAGCEPGTGGTTGVPCDPLRSGTGPNAGAGPSGEPGEIVRGASGTTGLPFTGLNLATVLLLGLFLIAAGTLLRAGVRMRRGASGLSRS